MESYEGSSFETHQRSLNIENNKIYLLKSKIEQKCIGVNL